jgi:hypothetical protein
MRDADYQLTPVPGFDPDNLSPETLDAFAKLKESIVPSTRIDGWTGAKQKRFLEAIADGGTVTDACSIVRMSVPSAYAFRRRARGQAFCLGWKAADLIARERIAADLLTRAIEGQEVRITRADGSEVLKHHYDNRLAVQMLNRLDRYADASDRTAPGHAARLVAAEFDAFLDLVGREGGPARAGLFMLAREEANGDVPPELEPVVALARADRLIRCGTALDGDAAVTDLDPDKRGQWTAEQWARAEAAGLIRLAPAPEPDAEEAAITPIHASTCSASAPDAASPADPVYWCELRDQWRTVYPPDHHFLGQEGSEYGETGYSRELSEEEQDVLLRPHRLAVAAKRALEEEQRDRFFEGAGDVEGLEDVDPDDVDLRRFDRDALVRLTEWLDCVRSSAPDRDDDGPTAASDATSLPAAPAVPDWSDPESSIDRG